jgi:acetoin utilization deacetylase AcuC-like enzyme
MHVYYTDEFVLPLPPGHRFPMERYRRLRMSIQSQGIVSSDDCHVPPAATDAELQLAHTADWVTRVRDGQTTEDEQRRIGFPWSPQMVERSRRSVGATIAAARCALTQGIGVNLAGGTHHASFGRGAGYCVFNDVAVAIRVLQTEQLIRRAAVIDCDVHHGDGTAEMFVGDDSVTTVSLFAEKAFPSRKPPGDIDVPFAPGTTDSIYLTALESALEQTVARGPFDLVFYLAGADPYEGDTLGGLALTKMGLQQRDRMVFETARRQNWPVAVSMAGGYAREIDDIVEIQANTVRLAGEILDRPEVVADPASSFIAARNAHPA